MPSLPNSGAGTGTAAPPLDPIPGPDNLMIVRDVLRAGLVRGMYGGTPLPSEAELQKMFHASRGTIRRALNILSEEGLIQRMRGTGTFTGPAKTRQIDEGFQGLGGPGSSIFHLVAERRTIEAPELIAPILRIQPGSPMLYLRRKTITGDGTVVSMFTSYLRLPLAEPLGDPSTDLSGEYYSTVEALLGRRIIEDDVMLEALPADEAVAAEMDIGAGSPVFHYERILLLDGNEPLEFGVGFQRGDRVRLHRSRTRS